MSEATIEGVRLCFYTRVRARHDGMLLSEWLLQLARREGIGGGSVFRASAGFGRHGVLHEEAFFELADDLPVKVEFLLSPAQAETLLARARGRRRRSLCNLDHTIRYLGRILSALSPRTERRHALAPAIAQAPCP